MKFLKISIAIIVIGFVIPYYLLSFIFYPSTPEIGIKYPYEYSEYVEIDSFNKVDGYTAYLPKDYSKDSINLIVLNHGWGAYNPMAHGAWIRHLVNQGYAVVFPRYQCTVLTPAKNFTSNAAKGINSAIKTIKEKYNVQPITKDMVIFGHSYGGVISVNLAIKWKELGIPKPKAVLAIQPGHGPIEGGRIDDYSQFPSDIKLLFIHSEKDIVTGDKFSREVFDLNKGKVENMNLIEMFVDSKGDEKIKAAHEDPLAMDPEFDKGTGFIVMLRAKMVYEINQADYFGFWKLGDALAKCSFNEKDCNIAFGNTPVQKYMGVWKDGSPIKEMKVDL